VVDKESEIQAFVEQLDGLKGQYDFAQEAVQRLQAEVQGAKSALSLANTQVTVCM
jgi:predicted HicB family RNase H-like nuclease